MINKELQRKVLKKLGLDKAGQQFFPAGGGMAAGMDPSMMAGGGMAAGMDPNMMAGGAAPMGAAPLDPNMLAAMAAQPAATAAGLSLPPAPPQPQPQQPAESSGGGEEEKPKKGKGEDAGMAADIKERLGAIESRLQSLSDAFQQLIGVLSAMTPQGQQPQPEEPFATPELAEGAPMAETEQAAEMAQAPGFVPELAGGGELAGKTAGVEEDPIGLGEAWNGKSVEAEKRNLIRSPKEKPNMTETARRIINSLTR